MDKFVLFWEVASCIATTVAPIVALAQYWRNSRDARAKTMQELMREFQRDYAQTFYRLVERKERDFYIGNLTFASDEDERNADAILLFMENVLHLRAKGTMSEDEFVHFKYYLKRIIADPDFGRYLHDFGMEFSKERSANPFAHILEFCGNEMGFFGLRDDACVTSTRGGGSADGVNREDALCVSEETFVEKLKSRYHGMTRTAKSVKSRVDNHLLRKGWSYANPPTKSDLLKAIKDADADIHNADVAASVRSALRQYYRASFGEEPNV